MTAAGRSSSSASNRHRREGHGSLPGDSSNAGSGPTTREEVGVELTEPTLTRIIHETVTDGSRSRHGYFAQFVARARSRNLQPGHEVVEARWFPDLPKDMAFRDDYLEDFAKISKGTSF